LPTSQVAGEINRFSQPFGLCSKNHRQNYQRGELQNGDKNQSPGETNSPSLGRQSLMSLIPLLSALGVCQVGGKYLYNDRIIIGAPILDIGELIAGAWWL
jgi:hypothetical protein